MTNASSTEQRQRLRQLLNERLSDSEMRDFCLDRDVDYERLPGGSKADKVRELIAYLDRRGRLAELVAWGQENRPDVPWDHVKAFESPELVQMRADYLASLRQRFEYLDLGGIAPRVQNRTVKLRMEDVFVPLQARPELESSDVRLDWMEEVPEGAGNDEMALRLLARSTFVDDARPIEVPELLRHPRVVVLGDPGSGKSTVLRHIAYTVACGIGQAIGQDVLARLPIVVRIVQFSRAQVKDPTLTLDIYIREVCERKWASIVQRALDTGQALVLLDGLDEVIDAHQRKSVAEGIQRLVADYPGNAFLITSRIVGYQAARLAGDFRHYVIQPLSPESSARFVQKWYMAIERESGTAELAEEARERAEELGRSIEQRPGIQRLAENPLLLTIIALVNWRGRQLPNRRMELYAHAAETLIESWPYRWRGIRMDTERVIRLLSPVAYHTFVTRSSGDIPQDELLRIFVSAVCRVDGVDEREAQARASELLGQISEHSGIFRERGYDERGRRVFGFLHLTFAEYFAARFLASWWEDLGEDGAARRVLLRKYVHVPRWREVVLLMAGDISLRDSDRATRAMRLLGDILSLNSDYEGNLHRDLLLAGECLANDLYVRPEAARYVLDRLLELALEPGIGPVVQGVFGALHETAYGSIVLEGLLARLEDGDGNDKSRVVDILGGLGDSLAVPPLVALLADESLDVTAHAALALGALGDPQAVDPLLVLLDSEASSIRASVIKALGILGDPRAVKPLLACLDDPFWSVRGRAASALGKLGDARAVEPLLARLTDENWGVRWRAARALKALDNEQAMETLLAGLDDEEVTVRWSAADAIGALGDKRAVGPLLAHLEDYQWGVRWGIVEALGELNDVRAVEPLIARLGDTDWGVRWRAALALGTIGDKRALDPLLACLNDENAAVRASAARALGMLGDARSVQPLLDCVKDENRSVRQNVARALGTLGDLRAIEPLLVWLKDEYWGLRWEAAEALGLLGDVRAVGPLMICLKDKDNGVQARAYKALIAILGRNAPQPELEEIGREPQSEPWPWDS